MRIKKKIKSIISLLKVRLLNVRVPLAVRWQLTNKCVLKCKYCQIWKINQEELSFKEILSVLDQLAKLGTKTISYSGGEPMLRDDIAEILTETKKRNISTEMNSAGAFIPENITKLKNLDFLKISLDGSEEMHDLVRGKGSYKMAIEAANTAKMNRVKFSFASTLTKYNVEQIPFLMSMAEKFNTFVAFQPIKNLYRGIEDIDEFIPNPDKFKFAVRQLIDFKKKDDSCIRNSLMGLYHIYNWPKYAKLKCWAGKIFCIIDTDGTVFPCDRVSYKSKLPNCRESSFEKILLNLPDIHCEGCGFCGVLELNLLMRPDVRIIKTVLRILK